MRDAIPLQPPAFEREAANRHSKPKTDDADPRVRTAQCEPRANASAEADRQPKRQLTALAFEEVIDSLARCLKMRPPIAPSTLWKMRSRYVRGARPLHCTIEKRGKCA